jgi:hypothetical protein
VLVLEEQERKHSSPGVEIIAGVMYYLRRRELIVQDKKENNKLKQNRPWFRSPSPAFFPFFSLVNPLFLRCFLARFLTLSPAAARSQPHCPPSVHVAPAGSRGAVVVSDDNSCGG